MTGDIIRYAFSADCASVCWSATAFAAAVVASVRRWWSIIAICATGRSCWSPCASAAIELHPNDPVQLQLTFRKAGKREKSKGFLEEGSVTVLPLLALLDAHTPELIDALADPEESRTSLDTELETHA